MTLHIALTLARPAEDLFLFKESSIGPFKGTRLYNSGASKQTLEAIYMSTCGECK